ncbi:MAG TPA: RNA polymerase sigma factor [Candidatus Polarisedimenticolaceae bacterium]|nr:RNA polymerase sigma factor [Candidatus Polarisedimenticolaceae bacterium]
MTAMEFQGAVLEHKDRVHSYARHILRDAEDAKDVAQECLVRLWRHRERIEPGPACRNWLLRTAHNLCIDRLRRRHAQHEVPGDDMASDPPDARPGPERLAQSSLSLRALERALMSLPERERAIVLLREVEGLAYDEIASLLGLNMGTLKATLHRTRERLRHALIRAEVTP